MTETIEDIRRKKAEIIETIQLFSAIKQELTSEESSPLISQISDFLEKANLDPEILRLTNEIERKEASLRALQEEFSKFDKRIQEAKRLQSYYFQEIQKDYQEAISK